MVRAAHMIRIHLFKTVH